MSADLSSDEGALRISKLPELSKVRLVKNRSESEINQFLKRAQNKLNSYFPQGAEFSSSDNNMSGKDLLEKKTKTHIELKSGIEMTDGNVGLGSVSWAIGDSEGKLKYLMSKGVQERRKNLVSGYSNTFIEQSKIAEMEGIHDLLMEKLQVGSAPDTLQHFVRSIAQGITKAVEIQASFKSKGVAFRAPLMLQADWNQGLVEYNKGFSPDENIFVHSIDRTSRVQLILKGENSGRVAKLYPHHRNSWKASSGQRFSADNWVSTGSFQVWIG